MESLLSVRLSDLTLQLKAVSSGFIKAELRIEEERESERERQEVNESLHLTMILDISIYTEATQ